MLNLLASSLAILLLLWSAPVSAETIIIDNSDTNTSNIHYFQVVNGSWVASTIEPGFEGNNYLHDGNAGGGHLAEWVATVGQPAEQYEVFAKWTAHPNRATNTKYTVYHAAGSTDVFVNQTQNGGA